MDTLEQVNMAEFEAEFTPTPDTIESLPVLLDTLGVSVPNLGQQEIVTASGSGSSNGVDLDGE